MQRGPQLWLSFEFCPITTLVDRSSSQTLLAPEFLFCCSDVSRYRLMSLTHTLIYGTKMATVNLNSIITSEHAFVSPLLTLIFPLIPCFFNMGEEQY